MASRNTHLIVKKAKKEKKIIGKKKQLASKTKTMESDKKCTWSKSTHEKSPHINLPLYVFIKFICLIVGSVCQRQKF